VGIQVDIQQILSNMSERGMLEWELAVQRTENMILKHELEAHTGEEE